MVDLGPARIGTPVTVLAFIDLGNGAYHRLWVDHAHRILRERVDAPGHFMDRDYSTTARGDDHATPNTMSLEPQASTAVACGRSRAGTAAAANRFSQ